MKRIEGFNIKGECGKDKIELFYDESLSKKVRIIIAKKDNTSTTYYMDVKEITQ